MMHIGSLLWVWRLDKLQDGSPAKIVELCRKVGAAGVLVKTRDGRSRQTGSTPALLRATRDALGTAGLHMGVWGWTYPAWGPIDSLGYVTEQAARLAQDAHDLGACLVVNNAEAPWSAATPENIRRWGSKSEAMNSLRARAIAYHEKLAESCPALSRGLSSFPRPLAHALPWPAFCQADTRLIGMPQIYFQHRANWPETVSQAVEQWQSIGFSERSLRVTAPAAPWVESKQAIGDSEAIAVALRSEFSEAHPCDFWHAGLVDLHQEIVALRTAIGGSPAVSSLGYSQASAH